MIIIKFYGGLGNQMFQFSFYDKLIQMGFDVKGDISYYSRVECHTGFELENIFKINIIKANDNEIKRLTHFTRNKLLNKIINKLITKKNSHISEQDFNLSLLSDNSMLYLEGYWQNQKDYPINEKLRDNSFIFINKLNNVRIKISNEIILTNSCSIHIRRGDYVENSLYVQYDELYYINSVKLINNSYSDVVFFIFSDDIKWVKDNFFINSKLAQNIHYIDDDSNPSDDMRLMSLCKHNIIANSSFSWWGAWLNKNKDKTVISPKNWYSDSTLNSKTDQLIPSSWIRL